MGCNSSKLDNEEAVQLCKDRKKFIKQAVEHHIQFRSSYAAYIESLRRVSAALHDYIEGKAPPDVLLHSYKTRSFTPVKKPVPRFVTISPKCFIETPSIQSDSKTCVKISYYQPSGNPVMSVEERLHSPETVQILSYSHSLDCGIDAFLAMQPPSFNPAYSPNSRPNASPQNNQWDFFWNPFSQLDYYGYPTTNLDRLASGLTQVPEVVPELVDETEHEVIDTTRTHVKEERTESAQNPREKEVIVEDVGKDKDTDICKHAANGTKSDGYVNVELSQSSQAHKVEVHPQEMPVAEHERKEETPGFTVYVNQRPTSMEEVIKDLNIQFTNVCNSAKEVSSLLESSHTKSSSNEISPMKMLNPVALFRSGSSRFSRFLDSSSPEGKSNTSLPAKSCIFNGSHQSTLDRLYAWEKRLYEEVRSAERIRQAYEKKCKQLTNRNVEGEDPSFVEKTKATIRDLYTQMHVAMHSIETISMRIETLRDEELHPQILELLKGLAGMWRAMAECHQTQKRTIDDAKLLLAGGSLSKPSKSSQDSATTTPANWIAQSSFNLETELRSWRSCFESWITSQRSYIQSLASWLVRCMPSDASKPELSSNAAPPIYGISIQWSRFMDKVSEVGVLDGLEFFATGMQSIYVHQMRVDSRRPQPGSIGYEEAIEEEAIEAEKIKELGTRVLCAGMSTAMCSLADFAMCSAEGYAELVNQWDYVKCPPPKSEAPSV